MGMVNHLVYMGMVNHLVRSCIESTLRVELEEWRNLFYTQIRYTKTLGVIGVGTQILLIEI